jgi:hypothetical protein
MAGLDAIPFVNSQRTRLNISRLGAIGDRIDADLAQGMNTSLIPELEALVDDYPHQERFWGQLMLALYRTGAQVDALRRCSRLRTLLQEDLGIDPSPPIAELEHAILIHNPSLDLPAHSNARSRAGNVTGFSQFVDDQRAPSSGEVSWSPRGSETFVGRHAEIELAWASRLEATAERVLLLIKGEPGIGKTRLVAEIASRAAAAGDLVIHGRWDEENLAPYQALREAMGDLICAFPNSALRDDLGAYAGDVARIVPELSDHLRLDVSMPGSTAEPDRYRIFEGVNAWLSAVASRRKLVLALDDLQWADRPSLLLLEFVLRSSSPIPFLIVCTHRQTSAQTSEWPASSLASLRRVTALRQLTLGGFSPEETTELICSAFGRSLNEVEALGVLNLHRHTDGNPFFLQAVANDLREGGASLEAWSDSECLPLPVPDQLRDVVRWRLRQLSAPTIEVLSAASAVGEEFSASIVGEALGYELGSVISALDEARFAGLLADGSKESDSHRFAHAIVRHALYEDVSMGRRAQLHMALATCIEARRDPRQRSHTAELARHYSNAGAEAADRALGYLRLAADEALVRLAYEAASEHLSRALEIAWDRFPSDRLLRCELLLVLGKNRLRAGYLEEANDAFLEAFDQANLAGNANLAAEAAIGYGGVLPAGAEADSRARGLLEAALTPLGNADSPLRAAILGRLSQFGQFDRPERDRRRLANEAVAVARRLGDPATLAGALEYRYWALDGPDDCDHRLKQATEIRCLGEELNDSEIVIHGLKCELHVLFELGEYGNCLQTAEKINTIANKLRQPEYLRLVCMWDSLVAGMQGDYQLAEDQATEALQIFERVGHPQAFAAHVGLFLPWRWLQGRMRELAPLVDRGRTGRNSPAEIALRSWVASEIHDDRQARTLVESVSVPQSLVSGHNFHWWFLAIGLARTAINLCDRPLGEILYEHILPLAEHNCRAGQATFLGAASLHLGSLASLVREFDQAIDLLSDALLRHEEMGARPFEVLTRTELASALRSRARPGDRARARKIEEPSAAIAAALGVPRALLVRPSAD